MPMAPKYRSALAKLRTGILPLEIEVGRYRNLPEDERFCKICDTGLVEDELHFLFNCPAYDDIRKSFFFDKAKQCISNFLDMDIHSKFSAIMESRCVRETARFVYNAYMARRRIVYPM